MSDRLVKLAEFENDFDAETLKFRLEDEGIKSVVTGENVHRLGYFGVAQYVYVEILEKDFPRAKLILESQELTSKQEKGDQ
jgi:putative signal transducing protein